MVGAAIRKSRVPNNKLHRVTDNRLAEADRKDLHGIAVKQTGKDMEELPVLRALKVSVMRTNKPSQSHMTQWSDAACCSLFVRMLLLLLLLQQAFIVITTRRQLQFCSLCARRN